MAAALLLLVAAAVAGTQAPASAFKPAAALMQRFPELISAVGGALSSAPPLAPPLACNISYTPVAGPRLSAIAASHDSGMLYGLGYGMQVVPEPWMEAAPEQRHDALWACGTKQQPCGGKWRPLQGPLGAHAIATDPAGLLYALDTMGRLFQAISGHPDVTMPVHGWNIRKLKFAAAGDGVPSLAVTPNAKWTVAASGALHSSPHHPSRAWEQGLKGGDRIRSLSAEPGAGSGGERLWAVDAAGKVWKNSCVLPKLCKDGDHTWHEVPSPAAMRTVVATAGAVRGVSADGSHWKCGAPCWGKWVAVPGAGGKLAQGGGRLWHLSDSGQLEVSPAC